MVREAVCSEQVSSMICLGDLIDIAGLLIVTGALAQSGCDISNTRCVDQITIPLFGKEKEQMC
jgi:hypothetical protein